MDYLDKSYVYIYICIYIIYYVYNYTLDIYIYNIYIYILFLMITVNPLPTAAAAVARLVALRIRFAPAARVEFHRAEGHQKAHRHGWNLAISGGWPRRCQCHRNYS